MDQSAVEKWVSSDADKKQDDKKCENQSPSANLHDSSEPVLKS